MKHILIMHKQLKKSISAKDGDASVGKNRFFKLFVYSSLILTGAGCQSNTKMETAAPKVQQSKELLAHEEPTIIPIAAMDHKLTKEDRNRLERHYPKTLDKIDNYQRLSPQDIINLTRSGVTDDVIIYEISTTRSVFFLTPNDENELDQAGVSKRVIEAMKETVSARY